MQVPTTRELIQLLTLIEDEVQRTPEFIEDDQGQELFNPRLQELALREMNVVDQLRRRRHSSGRLELPSTGLGR